MKTSVCALLLALLAFPVLGNAQFAKRNVEFNGGYAHITGNQGLDGFNAGAALYFTPRVSIAADYDSAWDTSSLGAFQVSQIGLVSIKSHVQDFLFGPRVFFPGLIKSNDPQVRRLHFFGEAQFGLSHLNSSLNAPQANIIDQSASDTAFTWMLGGGTDYRLNAHWSARGKLDLVRTHFNETGQSRLRFVAGLTYAFGRR